MDVEQEHILISQLPLFDVGESTIGLPELFPMVWSAAENLSSPDSQHRLAALEYLNKSGAVLSVGTRIYRPARLVTTGNGYLVEIDTHTMKDFGDGTLMLRAAPREDYLPDWLAVNWETAGGRVCVCDEPVPDEPDLIATGDLAVPDMTAGDSADVGDFEDLPDFDRREDLL